MLLQGYYDTCGGQIARIDQPIEKEGLGVIVGMGFVLYNTDGQFALKDEHPEMGDALDLIVSSKRERFPNMQNNHS